MIEDIINLNKFTVVFCVSDQAVLCLVFVLFQRFVETIRKTICLLCVYIRYSSKNVMRAVVCFYGKIYYDIIHFLLFDFYVDLTRQKLNSPLYNKNLRHGIRRSMLQLAEWLSKFFIRNGYKSSQKKITNIYRSNQRTWKRIVFKT